MKHFLIALVTLAVTLAFCIFACASVRQSTQIPLGSLRLAQIQAARGDFDGAADAVQAAEARWKRDEAFYDIVLRHEDVDAVGTGFSSLYQYALARDHDDFSASCAEMIARIQHIRRMQLPAVYNIL